jgi:large subunit ribosomal protein L4
MAGRKGKMTKQKGRGAARIGSKRTPLRKGGGTAFPPKPRDFSYTLPKKVLYPTEM